VQQNEQARAVKHTASDGSTIVVRCYSRSLTNGRVRATTLYTSAMIDWLAVYDSKTHRCFYVPARELGDGRTRLHLRLVPCSYNRTKDVRSASDYATVE